MMTLRSIKSRWKCPSVLVIKKGYLFRILVIGIVLLSSIYLIDYTKLLQRPSLLLAHDNDYSDDIEDLVIDENYFVKTNGCRIVKMDVMNEQIRSFFPTEKPRVVHCGPPPITDSDDRFLWINLTEVELKKYYEIHSTEHLNCFYTSFSRATDYLVVKNETINQLQYGQRARIDGVEFIQVVCENGNQSQIYNDFHSFFPSTPALHALTAPSQPPQGTSNTSPNSAAATAGRQKKPYNKFNVMILGIDSVSRLNFHRMFNVTQRTMLDVLGAVEMYGYNKVGDNTYPNLVPMLTGLSGDELNGACQSTNSSIYFDNCHFIWDDFKSKGYGNLFAEDSAMLSLFNYFKNGFEKQPTDFYFRTILHQMEKEIAHNKVGNYKLCLGQRRPVDILIQYMRKFVKTNADHPFFSFFWTSSMSHDFITYPMLIDQDLSDLLMFMKNEKYLDNTILFVMSDHGIRFGSFRQTTFQGMVEERLPFFYGVFPSSFKRKYPLAVRNFRRNSRRLTTHFDVYETLKDIANLDGDVISNDKVKKRSEDLKERGVTIPRGISMFSEIPDDRTCDYAGIESHWCTCYERYEMSNSDQRVQKAARFVVKTMNDIIKGQRKCHVLYLNSIVTAHMHVLNERVFNPQLPPAHDKTKSLRLPKGRKKIYDITLKMTTKPGLRMEFEATVRIDEINDDIKLTGVISRISTYSKGCVKDSFVEKYCYCDPI